MEVSVIDPDEGAGLEDDGGPGVAPGARLGAGGGAGAAAGGTFA